MRWSHCFLGRRCPCRVSDGNARCVLLCIVATDFGLQDRFSHKSWLWWGKHVRGRGVQLVDKLARQDFYARVADRKWMLLQYSFYSEALFIPLSTILLSPWKCVSVTAPK